MAGCVRSTFNSSNVTTASNYQSLNPDPVVPGYGHYVANQGSLVATQNLTDATGEAIPRNNYTIATPAGPPLINNFYFDPSNVSNPATPAYPLSLNGSGGPNLVNAFQRWAPSVSAAGNSDTYTAATYNFSGYNAFDTGTGSNPRGPTPAPSSFMTMTDSGGVTYVGDRARRRSGAIDKTTTNWSSGNNVAAYHAADLLGYAALPSGFAANWLNFRDPVWEAYGYDLDVVKYRAARGSGAPTNPASYLTANGGSTANILVPAADRFQGYSMGPGYWGKTFFMWPPDPRFDPTANVLTPDPNNTAYDKSGKPICDWRRRFFLSGSSTATPPYFDPQAQNVDAALLNASSMVFGPLSTTTSTLVPGTGVNNVFVATGPPVTTPAYTTPAYTSPGYYTYNSNDQPPVYHPPVYHPAVNHPATTTTPGYWSNPAKYTTTTVTNTVNYAAVLQWLKTGPQTLPPNLRAGRVLYYSSIPDDVNTATGTAQQVLDKAFWKNYIDFVFGLGNYTASSNLYGPADSWSASAFSIPTAATSSYQFSWESAGKLPYQRYTDSPRRPRLHLWFGPLSMLHFLTASQGTSSTTYNWLAGTSYQAHSWQLKAGMNAVLADMKNNHPNDYAGLVYFSSTYAGVRSPLGQDYTALQNALFYPKSLYPYVNAGNLTHELRPYTNTSLTGYSLDDIPNAGGTTDPNNGLAYAFNLLSPSTVTAAVAAGTGGGRRGAQKLVIFETDGVPNTYRALTFNAQGYNSYYTSGAATGTPNGDPTAMNPAYAVIQQMVKPMVATAAGAADSGLSLPNAPARVYPVAFGDLFDPTLSPNASIAPTAIQFLANCASYGGTGPAGATTLPSTQIITGTYTNRINNLRNCMQQIFQSGVCVVLVQ
ncbi:hypothetical protein [Frigoriglobus tundricola]|uniref:Uncharacterized protein n=1 Tax=Frigoriglobus tundricola TaxID=2774151 RepID=A0A6M5YV64_9BACT|nr:hypothetical protein [Frigoriglobus tundricola]QJW97123.1 hypothetical protein FTUN_4688 [Frigoriglobus tundricola]